MRCPPRRALWSHPVLSVYRQPGKADYTIGNVECRIYPEGDGGPVDAKQFDKAMRRLLALSRQAHGLSPTAGVPAFRGEGVGGIGT
jgi:hypothetical protein